MAEENDNITTQVLISIREELAGLRGDVKKLEEEQARTRTDLGRRIDQTNLQLKNTESRLATEISALRATVSNSNSDPDLRDRVEKLERDLAELKASKG